jgi:NitT/TauT family transport system permease protein
MSAADISTPNSFAAATRQRLAAQRRRERVGNILLTVAGIIGLLVIWEASVDLMKVPPYIIPSPARVFSALWSGLAVPIDSRIGFYMPLWNTLKHAALGFFIGASLGVILGSLMAEFRPLEIIMMPYAFALQSLPKIAIAPLIIVWCGFGNGSKVVMAALLTFFPMLVNSFAGMRSTEPERIDLMKALSASRLQTYLRVKLPTAAPYIFAGLDMGVVYALLGTIVAEFLGAQEGIGVVITQAQAVTDIAGVFAALVILGTVGIALHLLIRFAERHLVHWSDRGK